MNEKRVCVCLLVCTRTYTWCEGRHKERTIEREKVRWMGGNSCRRKGKKKQFFLNVKFNYNATRPLCVSVLVINYFGFSGFLHFLDSLLQSGGIVAFSRLGPRERRKKVKWTMILWSMGGRRLTFEHDFLRFSDIKRLIRLLEIKSNRASYFNWENFQFTRWWP